MYNSTYDFRSNRPKYEAILNSSGFRSNPKGLGIWAIKAAAAAENKHKSKLYIAIWLMKWVETSISLFFCYRGYNS